MVSAFLVVMIPLYSLGSDFPATTLPSSFVSVAHQTVRSKATWAFTQGIAKASISFSLIAFMMWFIVGVPKIMGTHATKFDKSGNTRAIWSSS